MQNEPIFLHAGLSFVKNEAKNEAIWLRAVPLCSALRASKRHEAVCNLGTTWLRLENSAPALPSRLGFGVCGKAGVTLRG